MACLCETYECVNVPVNPCTSGTRIPIASPITGSYTLRLEFNGTFSFYDIDLTEGSQFVLPTSMLNENYIHELVLDSSGNDAYCYNLKTMVSYEIDDVPVVGASNYIEIIAEAGDIITDSSLEGRIAMEVLINAQSYTRNTWFTQVGDTITMLNGVVFEEGQTVLIEFSV